MKKNRSFSLLKEGERGGGGSNTEEGEYGVLPLSHRRAAYLMFELIKFLNK
jgi:hypothetical protein